MIEALPLVVAFVVGIFVPMLTELVTHATAPEWVRSVLNLALSTLAGVLSTLVTTDYSTIQEYLIAVAVAWLASMRSHYAGMAKPVAHATGHFGLGAPTRTD